jgi:hypothetical protein
VTVLVGDLRRDPQICAAVEHELFPVGAVQSRLIWVREISAGKEIGLPAKEG